MENFSLNEHLNAVLSNVDGFELIEKKEEIEFEKNSLVSFGEIFKEIL